MPEEPRPQALWILNKLSGDLQNARMWPVKLAHLKHQEALSHLSLCRIISKGVVLPYSYLGITSFTLPFYNFIPKGKSFVGHADELEKSFLKLSEQTANKDLAELKTCSINFMDLGFQNTNYRLQKSRTHSLSVVTMQYDKKMKGLVHV